MYNIDSGAFPSIRLIMRYHHLSGITIKRFAALLVISHVSVLRQQLSGCSYVVSECQAGVTLLSREACLFVITMEDSFEFDVRKKSVSHLFGFGKRYISNIVNSHLLNCKAYA